GVEEQFYLLWPCVLAWAWKEKIPFFTVAALVAVFSFMTGIYTLYYDPPEAFCSPLSRFWELMLGAMLACPPQRPAWMPVCPPNGRSAIGAVLIAVGVAQVDRWQFPGWWALVPDAGAFLLIAAGPSAWFNRCVLASPALVRIGLISYPLYLWHMPL